MLRLLVLALLAATAYGGVGRIENRIVGGSLAMEGEFPSTCSLQSFQDHHCGCIIISEDIVLTTARCTLVQFTSALSVHGGATHVNGNGQYHEVRRTTTHALFDENNLSSPDIAFITLKDPFVWDNFTAPAILPEQDTEVANQTDAYVVGWGYTLENVGPISSQMLKAEQKIRAVEDCMAFYAGVATDAQLCADWPEGGKGVCNLDWGGPLYDMADKTVWGLASWGSNGCASKGYPAVFTRVASYRNWIRDMTGV